MKTSLFLFIATIITSCFNRYEKIIHGSYSLESREHLFLNDSTLVEGIVLDGQLMEPLSMKWITVKGSEIRTMSDSLGYFKLKLPEGRYAFKVASVGFTDLQTKKITLKKNEKLNLKFKLGTHLIYSK